MTITHKQLCHAADSVLELERKFNYSTAAPKQRYNWLTEAELTARLRATLVTAAGVAPDWLKVNSQGRKAPGAQNANIEEGMPIASAVEIAYCWAQRAAAPGKYLNDDLEWMRTARGRHVLAYLPRMRTGYAVQNNPTPYSLDGAPIPESSIAHILSECIQIGAFSPTSHALCTDVFDQVDNPASGKMKRWSLSRTPRAHVDMTIDGVIIERSILGIPDDNMWAIAWSQELIP